MIIFCFGTQQLLAQDTLMQGYPLNIGQSDSTPSPSDKRSIVTGTPDSVINIPTVDSQQLINKMRLNPKKAGMYSALIPGGGQIYNNEYWKLPIVYAALGTGVGFILHNNNNYKSARLEYSKRLSLRSDLDPKYERYDMFMLEQEQDYYKEYLDMSVLLTSLGYILQIMDAVAFNHLKGFDISPDISMRFKMSPLHHHQIGLGVAFHLK